VVIDGGALTGPIAALVIVRRPLHDPGGVLVTNELPKTMRQLRSLVTADGTLELSLANVDVPQPQPNEVLVRIEAAPINPSDLGLLIATADLDTASSSGTADNPVVTASIPPQTLRGLAGRTGQSMPVGN